MAGSTFVVEWHMLEGRW